jgi:hypothetical protein
VVPGPEIPEKDGDVGHDGFLRTAEANLPPWFRGGSIISPFRQGKNERDGTIFWGRDVD